MIEALRASNGVQSAAARMLGCHRSTVKEYIEKSDRIREVVEEEKQGFIDLAENKLMQLIQKAEDDGDLRLQLDTLKFVLSTLGKDRGYFKKRQGGNINANVVNVLNQVFPKIEESGEIDEDELDEIIQAEIEDSED